MSPAPETVTETVEDRVADRRLLLFGVLILSGLFALGASVQSIVVHEMPSVSVGGVPLHPIAEMVLRFTANLVAVAALGFGATWWRLTDRGIRSAVLLAVPLSILASLSRLAIQLLFGVHTWDHASTAVTDAITAVPIGFVSLVTALALVFLRRQARTSERERRAAGIRATEALGELQQEELRVRRDVADALHGSLQSRFLLLGATIGEIADELGGTEAGSSSAAGGIDADRAVALGERLRRVRSDLDHLRERELRELSAALYPEALDRGLVPACRALVARIPRSIPVRFDSGVTTPDPLDRHARLLLVRVVEEGVSNALRHGEAAEISVGISEHRGGYAVEVGHRGVEPASDPRLSGLARLRSRLADHGGGLTLAAEPGGGALRAWIPAPGSIPD